MKVNIVAVFFLELSKAVDSVQHDISLCKLERHYGFNGNALELLKSYLTNKNTIYQNW